MVNADLINLENVNGSLCYFAGKWLKQEKLVIPSTKFKNDLKHNHGYPSTILKQLRHFLIAEHFLDPIRKLIYMKLPTLQ